MADKIRSQSAYTAVINAPIEWVDIADWLLHLPDAEYRLGMLDSPAEYEVVRAIACRGSELAREVHPAHACRSGKVRECDRLRNVCIDVSESPHQAPFRQGSYATLFF